LTETCLPKTNAGFAPAPAGNADGHAPLPGACLRELFVFEHTKVAGNDRVVRFERRHFQILKDNRIVPGDKVVIRIRLDGTLDIYWQGKALLIKELDTEKQGAVSPMPLNPMWHFYLGLTGAIRPLDKKIQLIKIRENCFYITD
jgi:hypothetical protein